jgi:hypothetical protein
LCSSDENSTVYLTQEENLRFLDLGDTTDPPYQSAQSKQMKNVSSKMEKGKN